MKDEITKVVEQETRLVEKVYKQGEEPGPLEMVEKIEDVPYFLIPNEPLKIKKDDYIAQKETRKQELIDLIANAQREIDELDIEIPTLKAL